MEDTYHVQLSAFEGPLDLLLYLIRRDEVDIHDIPIARITDQYFEEIKKLPRTDLDLAGDFLVMASTLMVIKSRMLLPAGVKSEEEDFEEDPRAELVQQLLEYRRYKEASDQLRDMSRLQAQRFPRGEQEKVDPGPSDEDPQLEIDDLSVFDLCQAFARLMDEVRPDDPHCVVYDDTPVEQYMGNILEGLGSEGEVPFERLFAGASQRLVLAGIFLALLELTRQGKIRVRQETQYGPILVSVRAECEPAGA